MFRVYISGEELMNGHLGGRKYSKVKSEEGHPFGKQIGSRAFSWILRMKDLLTNFALMHKQKRETFC